MTLKSDAIIGLLSNLESQANNRAAGNKLSKVIREVKEVVKARKSLGEDPDLSKLPSLYAKVAAAVTEFNGANTISMPSISEVQDLVNAAQSAEGE